MQKAVTENHPGITSFEKLLRALLVTTLKSMCNSANLASRA